MFLYYLRLELRYYDACTDDSCDSETNEIGSEDPRNEEFLKKEKTRFCRQDEYDYESEIVMRI